MLLLISKTNCPNCDIKKKELLGNNQVFTEWKVGEDITVEVLQRLHPFKSVPILLDINIC